MVIGQEMVGDTAVLKLSGAFTLTDGSGTLKDKVNSLVFQGHKQIALDLGGLSYMDSAGLGELVSVHATVSRGGGEVKLCRLTKRVSDLLTITKLLTVFDVYDSQSEAVKSFAG
jgi:anti-sigma B factor antagonist